MFFITICAQYPNNHVETYYFIFQNKNVVYLVRLRLQLKLTSAQAVVVITFIVFPRIDRQFYVLVKITNVDVN